MANLKPHPLIISLSRSIAATAATLPESLITRENFLRDLCRYSEEYSRQETQQALAQHLLRLGAEVRNGKRHWTKLDLMDITKWRRLSATKARILQSAPELEQTVRRVLGVEGDSKVDSFCKLSGFGPVLASVIMRLVWPEEYGILDYHAWTALRILGFDISIKPYSGGGYTAAEYLRFLEIIRKLSSLARSSPAEIADALHAFHILHSRNS